MLPWPRSGLGECSSVHRFRSGGPCSRVFNDHGGEASDREQVVWLNSWTSSSQSRVSHEGLTTTPMCVVLAPF